MPEDHDELIEQHVTQLEYTEATIAHLVALLSRAGLYDDDTLGHDVLRVQRELGSSAGQRENP